MTPVAIALGSNLGERIENMQKAVQYLKDAVQQMKVSRIYESPPMYVVDQPPFLNAAVSGVTKLDPHALLRTCKQIECKIGRQKRIQNGPREIDIDIILYGNLTLDSKTWKIHLPHPRMMERLFVVQPLIDLGISNHPVNNQSLHTASQILQSEQTVTPIDATVRV